MKFSSFFPFFGTILACLCPDSDPDQLIHMIRIRSTNTCLPALTELQCCKISLVDPDLNSQIKYTASPACLTASIARCTLYTVQPHLLALQLLLLTAHCTASPACLTASTAHCTLCLPYSFYCSLHTVQPHLLVVISPNLLAVSFI